MYIAKKQDNRGHYGVYLGDELIEGGFFHFEHAQKAAEHYNREEQERK